MRSLLAPLALACVLVSAGCVSAPSARPQAPDSATPRRASPSPTATEEPTPTPAALPERPDSLTTSSAVEFVEAYERTFKRNRELTGRTVQVAVNPVRAWVNVTDTGFLVHLEVGYSKRTRYEDGSMAVGDGFYTVNYFVNESTTMRAEHGGQVRPGPDPRDGIVLQ